MNTNLHTLTLLPSVLLGALDIVRPAVSNNLLNAANDTVLMEVAGQWLKLTATNLETTITTSVKVEIPGQPFRAAVPVSTLVDTLKLLPKKPVAIKYDPISCKLVLLGEGKARYSMMCEIAEDFPLPTTVRGAEATGLNASQLSNSLAFSLPSVAKSEKTAPVQGLIGLLFAVKSNCAETCAAQSHFASGAAAGGCKGANLHMLLSVSSCNILLALLARYEGEVSVIASDTAAVFGLGNTQLHARLLIHEHPGIDNFFQPGKRTPIDFERQPVLDALTRLKNYSGMKSGLELRFADGRIRLFVSNSEWAREAEEWYPCNMPEGFNQTVTVTLAYLQRLLSPIRSERVQVNLGQAPSPLHIYPYVEKGKPSERIVLMPYVAKEVASV
ncbi:hypothetical protein [Hymenobacter cavernae]|uniref:Beta sliding clamp n=1 Tax=Hymenobacter cavernae TaxID=2044852 RepID=A0ABQ1UPS3_9BACT|nr:hypothetical protein [Hymenobacter cavernae]GGF22441.1 hypothetical protein GCM10011383_37600 [Hymenobacter cavernae]